MTTDSTLSVLEFSHLLAILLAATVAVIPVQDGRTTTATVAESMKITAQITRAEEFDWGNEQWGLIALSYVGARDYALKVSRSLGPGRHRSSSRRSIGMRWKAAPIGGAVVFDTNELLKLFGDLRAVRYENTNAKGDFGLADRRVVRLAAVKP